MTLRIATTVCILFLALTVGAAQAAEWDLSAELAVESAYVWRGMVVNDEPVLQPSIDISSGYFGANVWANQDLTDSYNDMGSINEVDFTIYAMYSLPLLDFEGGIVQFAYPDFDEANTREIYASATASAFLIQPSIFVAYDIDLISGTYAKASVSQSIPMGFVSAIEWTAGVGFASKGYNGGYYEVNKAGLNDAAISLAWNFSLPNGATLSPTVGYSALMNSDVSDAMDDWGLGASQFTAGIHAGYSF